MDNETFKMSKVLFASEDGSDFRIMKALDASGKMQTIKGNFPELRIDLKYECEGKWVEDGKWGRQFVVQNLRFLRPSSHSEVAEFMQKVARVPKGMANKIVARWGDETLERLVSASPSEFREITGVDVERCEKWSGCFRSFLGSEHIVSQLCEIVAKCGFTQTAIKQIADRWQAAAPDVVRRRPYRTMEFDGVGFAKADAVFLKTGRSKDRLLRHMLAIASVIEGQESTWMMIGDVVSRAEHMLKQKLRDRAVDFGIRAGILEKRDNLITLTRWADQEAGIASKIKRMLGHPPTIHLSNIPSLSEHQMERLRIATSRRVGILTGGPGTGKTFCASALIKDVLRSVPPESISVVAPTGKAAVRLTEVMASHGIPISAKTIHSWIGVKGVRHDGTTILDEDAEHLVRLMVVDESSMIPTDLLASMIRAVDESATIVFLGDTGQLPPIGHGAPLRDMVYSCEIPVGHLTEVRRNSGAIVRVCSEIANEGKFSPSKCVREKTGDNVLHLERTSTGIMERIENIFRSPPPGLNASSDIQVLSPLKKRECELGTPAINAKLRTICNPTAEGPITVGDKVYVKQNTTMPVIEKHDNEWKRCKDTFVANGEFGFVVDEIPKSEEDKGGLVVALDAPRRNVLVKQRSQLDFGWAVTVHKSQGSEWPMVMVVADKSSFMLGSKQLIYTAISRAKRLAVTIGQRSVIESQIKKDNIRHRKTRLEELLKG